MKWSVTFDKLPGTARIGGIVYDISFGYRTMMAAEIEMFRQDISDEQKMLNALNLFYARNIPPDLDAAVDYMLWFHRGGEPEHIINCRIWMRQLIICSGSTAAGSLSGRAAEQKNEQRGGDTVF